MRFYSDKTKNLYDSMDELQKAEKEFDAAEDEKRQKAKAKKARAAEVDEARKNYESLKKKYIEDYGSYNYSLDVDDFLHFLLH